MPLDFCHPRRTAPVACTRLQNRRLRHGTAVHLGLFFFASWLGGSALFAQGSLTPPGAPAPTMKSLAEVEPRIAVNATNTPGNGSSQYRITQPGSYYLTGNITGVLARHGIDIAASGVTLDLNGFELLGIAQLTPFHGIYSTGSNLTNIAIVNGSVRNWRGAGVALSGASNVRCSDLQCSDNVGGSGISVGSGSVLSRCLASRNSYRGIETGDGSVLQHCTAYGNSDAGIVTARYCVVAACTANVNGGGGIASTSGCTISLCAASQNIGSGITTAEESAISQCTASFNSASGINVTSSCSIADCAAHHNTLDGITVATTSLVRGNTCNQNGFVGNGAGIHASGGANRIENNHCLANDRGIEVSNAATSNLIIKNTCRSNGINWVITAGNALGPIIAVTTNPSAVSGNTYTGALGSTDPNANFSH